MGNTGLYEILTKCLLFRGVERERIEALDKTGEVRFTRYAAGEKIPLTVESERALVVLTHGTALAYSRDAERSVILRSITPYTAFGVSILFSEEEPVSLIRAKTSVEAFAIPASLVEGLIGESAVFRRNYIAFLSGRIRFLNRRIACYTAGSAERRLALYLLSLAADENGVTVLDVPLTDLSELLDVARASLYRAFTRLSESGLIERTERTVRILDRDGLLRYESEKNP